MGVIDKGKVKRSFGRQAGEYDRHCEVQKTVVSRFLQLIRSQNVTPTRVLDIGTGTGQLLRMLSEVGEGKQLYGIDLAPEMCREARRKMEQKTASFISADAEELPFAAHTFDLVVSTSSFQWLNHLHRAFTEAFRVLAPGGSFCFAMFGENTLFELKHSYRHALVSHGKKSEDRTHSFNNSNDVSGALASAGFDTVTAFSENYSQRYCDLSALLRALKKIGAGNAVPAPSRGLSGRKIFREMDSFYQRHYGSDGQVTATYHVIYVIARKR